MVRYRTIRGAHESIKEVDPGTAITEYWIRQLVLNEEIKSKKSGVKYLIDLDELIKYLTEADRDGKEKS